MDTESIISGRSSVNRAGVRRSMSGKRKPPWVNCVKLEITFKKQVIQELVVCVRSDEFQN